MVSITDLEKYADALEIELSVEQKRVFVDTIPAYEELLGALEIEPEPVCRNEQPHFRPDSEEDPLGAFLTRCDITESTKGRLEGTTVGVKDNIAVAGVPMTCGSPPLVDFIPDRDATVVRRLLEEGATIAGKTNMDEFANGGVKSTMRFKLARNPADPDRMPGFSSSGSGVAVATSTVDAALGTDTGGSVRLPAAWCGVIGIKPTRGLVSHHGFVQFGKTIDNIGVLANSTATTAEVLETIAGEDPYDERTAGTSNGEYRAAVRTGQTEPTSALTIGVPSKLNDFDTPVAKVVEDQLSRWEEAGADLRPVSINRLELAIPAWLAIGLTEFREYVHSNGLNYWLLSEPMAALSQAFDETVSANLGELSDALVEMLLFAERLQDEYGDQYYNHAQRARRLVTAEVDDALSEVDVLAMPTVPQHPPTWDEGVENLLSLVPTMAPFNLTGHPAISVPCGQHEDLPVGLQLVGNRFDEGVLFRVATHVEQE